MPIAYFLIKVQKISEIFSADNRLVRTAYFPLIPFRLMLKNRQ